MTENTCHSIVEVWTWAKVKVRVTLKHSVEGLESLVLDRDCSQQLNEKNIFDFSSWNVVQSEWSVNQLYSLRNYSLTHRHVFSSQISFSTFSLLLHHLEFFIGLITFGFFLCLLSFLEETFVWSITDENFFSFTLFFSLYYSIVEDSFVESKCIEDDYS